MYFTTILLTRAGEAPKRDKVRSSAKAQAICMATHGTTRYAEGRRRLAAPDERLTGACRALQGEMLQTGS